MEHDMAIEMIDKIRNTLLIMENDRTALSH